MKELIALVNLVDKNKVKNLSLIDSKGQDSINVLYSRIADGKITSDDDLFQYIQGKSDNHSVYASQLKRRLRDRLINTLLFIDYKKTTNLDKKTALKYCWKAIASAKLLIIDNHDLSALSLLKKVSRLTTEYEFFEEGIIVNRMLLGIYYLKFNKNNYSKIENEIKALESKFVLLNELNLIDHQLVMNPVKISFEIGSRIEEYFEVFRLNTESIRITYAVTRILFYYLAKIRNKRVEALQLIDKTITRLEGSKFTEEYMTNLLLDKIEISLSFRDCDISESIFHRVESFVKAKSYVWFRMMYFRTIYYIRIANYAGALKYHSQMMKDYKRLSFMPLIESINILDAYFHLFITIGLIEEKIVKRHRVRPFSLARFLNDVPNLSKDKTGHNVSIRILQLVILLKDKKYSKLIDYFDPLNQYSYRHLHKSDRARIFINTFIKMFESNSPPEMFSDVLRNKLNASSDDINIQNEIVPFEALWGMVILARHTDNNK